MDDMTFEREKKRREVQEILTHLDAATTAEPGSEKQKTEDMMAAVNLTALSIGMGDYIKFVMSAHGMDLPEGGGLR